MTQIRTLLPEHADAFRALRLRGIQELPSAFANSPDEELARPENYWRDKLLASSNEDVIFGAFAGEQLVGIVGVYRLTLSNRRHKAFVWGMYVTPEFRGQGLAAQLVSAAVERARSWNGVESVMLGLELNNQPARALYEKLGFKMWGAQERAAKIGDVYLTEVHMELDFTAAA